MKHPEGYFPDDLFNQLAEQIFKKNQELTISNFAEVWVEADERLDENITNLQKEINELEQEREDYILEKKEASKTEQLNANHIMKDSSLTVEFLHAANLCNKHNQPTNGYFVLSCEG